jgi:FtsP/CotA-like multicopper oxidase with cupredoxin domain
MKRRYMIFGVVAMSLAILVMNQAAAAGSIGSNSSSNKINSNLSAEEYDKLKNCTTDTNKQPNSIEYLTHFNCGRVSQTTTADGNKTTLREFTIIVRENQQIPISDQGHFLDAWTFNGTVPGPTIRMTEGDLVRITVINDKNNKHAHTMHMHSIHKSEMDGVQSNAIMPGDSFTYEFIAQPFGVFPYHCHVDPIADHINRGLYGALIIDPKTPRPQMPEMVMMMNGYDLDYDQEGMTTIRPPEESGTIDLNDESEQDGTSDNSDDNSNDNNDAPVEEKERDNEIYTVNGKAFDYVNNPIQLKVGQKYRIYVVNMLEFDLINSLHVHGAMFEYYPAGTSMSPQDSFVHDVIELGQGDRGIMELEYKYPGQYMFHAHVTEFTDLGWMGFFNVAAKGGNSTINSSSNNETTAMTGHTSDKVGPHQDLSPVFPYFK